MNDSVIDRAINFLGSRIVEAPLNIADKSKSRWIRVSMTIVWLVWFPVSMALVIIPLMFLMVAGEISDQWRGKS